MTTAEEWQRPHPLTVIVLISTFVASNAWPIGVVLIAGGGGLGFDVVAVALGGATVAWGALGWYMTRYSVSEEAVHYRSGVLSRQARSIPLDRIQQVSVNEPLLARAVGLAVVQVSEASADGDVEIQYLGRSDAVALAGRLRLLAQRADGVIGVPGDGASVLPAPPPRPPRPAVRVHETAMSDLLTYRMAALAPVALLLGVAVLVLATAVGLSSGVVPGLFTLLGAGAVLLVIVVVATVGESVQLGNFVLARGDHSLVMEAGLLSHRQIEVRPDRIQTLTVTSGPVARLFGLHEVTFSAATGKAVKNQPMVHLAPAVRTDAVGGVVQGSIDVDPGFGVDLERVSDRTVRRTLVRAGLLYILVGLPASVGLFVIHPVAAVLCTALWWAVAVWYARARYRRLGLSLDDQRLVVRRGVLQHHLTQLPLGNIQSVVHTASFFQRRLGLSSLRVTTAGIGPGNTVLIPDLVAARADVLLTRLAGVAAASHWEIRR